MPIVQHISSVTTLTSGTSTTTTLSFPSNTTAGNSLVACIGLNGAGGPSVTSVKTNSVAENWASATNDSDSIQWIYVNPNTGGGQKAVNVAWSFGGTASTSNTYVIILDIFEVSGVVTSAVVDKVSTADQGPGTTWSSGATATTSQANETLIGCVYIEVTPANTTGSITPPASLWTNETGSSSSFQSGGTGTADKFFIYQQCSYQIVSSTGTYSYAGTDSPSGTYAAASIVTLKNSAVTGTGSLKLAPVALSGTGSVPFVGSGGITLAPVSLSGAMSVPYVGTGTVALAPLHMQASNIQISGTGHLTLAPMKLHAGGLSTFGSTGTGTVKLAPLRFTGHGTVGGALGSAPAIPTEPAGVIASSDDWNAWVAGAEFLATSGSEQMPVFFLQADTAQTLTTSFTAVTYTSAAAIYLDNRTGWASGHASRYTIPLAGYYHIEWMVSANSSASYLECYAQVTTGSGNPYNPSTTVQFQHSNRADGTSMVANSSGGLIPVYLVAGDYIEIYAKVGTSETTVSSWWPQLSGQWVSE